MRCDLIVAYCNVECECARMPLQGFMSNLSMVYTSIQHDMTKHGREYVLPRWIFHCMAHIDRNLAGLLYLLRGSPLTPKHHRWQHQLFLRQLPFSFVPVALLPLRSWELCGWAAAAGSCPSQQLLPRTFHSCHHHSVQSFPPVTSLLVLGSWRR